jgi:hypothetical protein
MVAPNAEKIYEGGYVEIDRAKERRLVRKLDLHIVPMVMLLYLLSFLDRWVIIKSSAHSL